MKTSRLNKNQFHVNFTTMHVRGVKKLFLLCLLFAATKMSFAQGLSGVNYQAVARNLNGTTLINQPVLVRFTITAGNGGAIQYRELQTTNTNAYGLFNLIIGKGTPSTGTFSTVPWLNANQWLEVEVSVNGGVMNSLGKMAFQAVPYSLMASQALPSGPAGGDLAGTYPNPAVAKLQGKAVSNTAPTAGQALVWNATTLAWEPSSAIGGSNLWTKTGTNLYNTTLTDNVGVGTATPKGKITVQGNGAIDTTISPDLSGNSRINTLIRNNETNAGNNVGLFATTGNAQRNVGIYSTSTQSANASAAYQGLLINNYDNHLTTSNYVEGIYNDVGNAGTGNATGMESYTHTGTGDATGIYNNVSGQGTIYGFQNSVTGQGSISGISNFTESYGIADFIGIGNISIGDGLGTAEGTGAWNVADNFGKATGAKNWGVGEAADIAIGSDNLAMAYGTGATIGTKTDVQNELNTTAGNAIGILSTVNTGVTTTTGLDAVANPAGYFESNGGQGIYSKATVGHINSNWLSPVAQSIVGVANTTGAGIVNQQGLVGIAGNGTKFNSGVYGLLSGTAGTSQNAAIVGNDLINTANTFAGLFSGKVAITDGTQGAGKVFTSDASGVGSWQTPAAGGGSSLWTKTGTKLYQTTLTDNVGIGTAVPVAKMEINGFDETNNAYATEYGFSATTGLAVKDKVSAGMNIKAGMYSYVDGGLADNLSIMGEAGKSAVLNVGLFGTVPNAPTAGGFSAAIYGSDGANTSSTYALVANGKIQLNGIGEANGRVLATDPAGNATWQDLITPDVHVSAGGLAPTAVPASTLVVLKNWANMQMSILGAANYDATTGEYTIPVAGYYSISADIGWGLSPAVTGTNKIAALYINVNGITVKSSYSNSLVAGEYPSDIHAGIERLLAEGDKITFSSNQGSNANMNVDESTMGIHLIHK